MPTTIEPLTNNSDANSRFGIGQPLRRFEDIRFVRGAGRYVDDDVDPKALHAVFLRSVHAHADIHRIDVASAKSMPGVVEILTGADWTESGLKSIPARPSIKQFDGSPIAIPARPALAVDRVMHVGDCVAMVIADSVQHAADAAEKIEIDYAVKPAIVDLHQAVEDASPLLWPDVPRNVSFRWRAGDVEKTEAALKQATHVITLDLVNNRLIPNSMEPRGVIANYDKDKNRIALSGSIQNPFGYRDLICDLFGWPKDKLYCRASDVGGGFGCKNQVQPEHIMLVFACERLRRKIKWINDRGASFLSDAHARDLFTKVRLGIDASGKFKALAVDTLANLGAYMSTNGALIPTLPTAAVLGGAYDIAAIAMEVQGVFTNTVPIDAYRGAGRPEAIYLLERTIDFAAAQLGISPIKMRRQNLIKRTQFPYKTALGQQIDVGNFDAVLSKALDLADEKGFAKRAKLSRKQKKLRGLGVAYYLEATLGPPADSARIAFAPNGRATLSVGTQSNGQGHETTMVQIAASQFGISPDKFSFRQADTEATPIGGGHGGSRSLHLGGTATLLSARKIIERGRTIASHLLEAGERDIEFKRGKYTVAGTDRAIAFEEVVQASFDPKRIPPGEKPGLDETASYEREGYNFPNGCHVCELEIDQETGRIEIVNYSVVDDFGRIINPMIVRGQVLGGIVQGIGQALYEETRYDEGGQLLTASFMDYSLPRAEDISKINIELYEDAPTQTNPLGAKGCGEAGATGAPPAVVNAVVNALKDYGVTHLDMPLTPEKIWPVLRKAQ